MSAALDCVERQEALLQAVDEALSFDAATSRLLVPPSALKLAAAAAVRGRSATAAATAAGAGSLTEEEFQEAASTKLWLSFQVESALDVFAERRDWLLLWLRCELQDALEKMQVAFGEEASWQVQGKGANLAGIEELSVSGGIFGACPAVPDKASVLSSLGMLEPEAVPAVAQQLVDTMQAGAGRCARLSNPVFRLAFTVGLCRPVLLVFFHTAEQRLAESEAAGSLVQAVGDVGRAGGVIAAAWHVVTAVEQWQEEEGMLEVWMAGSEALRRVEEMVKAEESEGKRDREKEKDWEQRRLSVGQGGSELGMGGKQLGRAVEESEEESGWEGVGVESSGADGWEVIDEVEVEGDEVMEQRAPSSQPTTHQQHPVEQSVTSTSRSTQAEATSYADPQPANTVAAANAADVATADLLVSDGLFSSELASLRQLSASWTDRLARTLGRYVCTLASEYREQRTYWLMQTEDERERSRAGKQLGEVTSRGASDDGNSVAGGPVLPASGSSGGAGSTAAFELSPALVHAAATLRSRLHEAKEALPVDLFDSFWRRLAGMLDSFLCDDVVIGKERGRLGVARSVAALVKRKYVAFSCLGGQQYAHDVQVSAVTTGG